jgi:hypothetical protein
VVTTLWNPGDSAIEFYVSAKNRLCCILIEVNRLHKISFVLPVMGLDRPESFELPLLGAYEVDN